MRPRLISAVDHVVEHPQVWTQRLSRKWGDRVPHIVHSADGTDCWVIDDTKIPLFDAIQVGALMADRAELPRRWEDIPKIAYDPQARLNAMDEDAVDCVVLYPSAVGFSGETLGRITDPELELACVQAYNDWLIEEWTSASRRFIPQCLVPLWPPQTAAREIERAVAKGHRGVIFPAAPMNLRKLPHINGSDYDPIWAACQDLEVPLCFHAGSSSDLQFPVSPALAPEIADALRAVTRAASATFDLTNILFSRILLRFPKLNVVFAASTIGWGIFLLEYADHQYEQDHCDYELKPSEIFRRQCFLTTWYDSVEINARYIGAHNILWSSNFPNANSTWPDSQKFAMKSLDGMSHDAGDRILWANAARLYKISGESSPDYSS